MPVVAAVVVGKDCLQEMVQVVTHQVVLEV